MAATMPNNRTGSQPENQPPENPSPEEEMRPLPAWVGVVKGAVVIMSVLIVLGLILLVYGLATGMNRKKTETPPVTLKFPSAMQPADMASTPDGGVMLLFRADNGQHEVITLSPDGRRITSRVTLAPGEGDFSLDK